MRRNDAACQVTGGWVYEKRAGLRGAPSRRLGVKKDAHSQRIEMTNVSQSRAIRRVAFNGESQPHAFAPPFSAVT